MSKNNSQKVNILEASVPPQATDTERAVLGAALIEQEALYEMLELVQAKDFYDGKNRLIFEAIQTLFESNSEIDQMLIEQHLADAGSLEAVGGRGYIADLYRHVGSAAHTGDYCQTIIQKRRRREAIEGFRKMATIAADTSLDFNDVLSRADDVVFNLINDDRAGNTQPASRFIVAAYEQIISRQGSPDGVTGIGTGLDIDQITAGWQPSEFIVIAARPGMGKTAFVLQSMKYAAEEYGAAGVLSLEMSGSGLGERLLVAEAGIDGQRARRGQLTDEELDALEEAAGRLKDIGLIIDDTTFVNPSKLRAKARAMIHKYGIKVLAVDYVQLLTSDKDNREQQVAEISRTCKAIAKEYNIPVIGLSQLNRSCETRRGWDKRPQLADLRESGAIEQDADVVGFLFRPRYYDLNEYPETGFGNWSGASTQNVCEIIISKNRNGMSGTKNVGFEQTQTRFYNLTPEPNHGLQQALRRADQQHSKYNIKSPF